MRTFACYSALHDHSFSTIVASITGAQRNVGLIQLNRPKVLNALCKELMSEMNVALTEFQIDKQIGAIVITGSEKAFAGNAIVFSLSLASFHDPSHVAVDF